MSNTLQSINKSISINASKQKVWSVLFQDEYIRIWYAEFSEGSHAQTDWQPGSKAIFTDDGQGGLIGTITTSQPHDLLVITYQGILTNGQEDYDSPGAQAFKNAQETYALSENNGLTQLSVSCEMSAEYVDFMSAAWDNALLKIKQLSESNQ